MIKIYFSEFFEIAPEDVDAYGAFDISLVNDLPLFIDPFLLFNSQSPVYQRLHAEMIRYMLFLKTVTLSGPLSPGLISALFRFPEVRQNWLGFCEQGNRGRGLGIGFAKDLHRNFSLIFQDFGLESITKGSHVEKLCLVRDGVGKDNISDFATNLLKTFLAEFTQSFARQYIRKGLRKDTWVQKASFNYATQSWAPAKFELPWINNDYVLLTPQGHSNQGRNVD